jgi:S-DNA-T family DNA segregation ATPase FtsK/SpoIIIE
MSKRRRRKKQELANRHREGEEKASWHSDLHPETKKATFAVISFMMATLLVLSFIGKAGNAGNTAYGVLEYLLGKAGYFFAPLSFILIGFSLLFSERRKVLLTSVIGGILFLFSSLSLLRVFFGDAAGGLLGRLSGGSLLNLFDFWASVIIAVGFFMISLLLMLNVPIWQKADEEEEEIEEEEAEDPSAPSTLLGTSKKVLEKKGDAETPAEPVVMNHMRDVANEEKDEELPLRRLLRKNQAFAYRRPPLDLLQGDRGTPSSGDIKANANIIKRTLENFGIEVDMSEVSIGPTVTQYTLKPAEGVKLSRIVALHNDLSLALAAHPIRIEAPIPRKSLVGIEVPNKSIALVGLRALLENKIMQESANPLLFALGRDVTGSPVFADLARMPHLLISGATGSGKSVSVHTIMTSFLFRNPPEVLRFIVVDPKRVELSVYNDIPHLLTPVITEPKKTVQALRWATREMDRRYELLSRHHARDIISFNNQTAKTIEEPLPYIVIIIDELADLMSMYPREVEASIIRLAQMARAVGIHLIVATQRPSVEVITGLIKANITSRMAFQVASQIDSRTILDMAGAEKLLGNGDMLFLAGDTSKPRRIQGGFISEAEVKRVVGFLHEEAEAPEYDESILAAKPEESRGSSDDFNGDDDSLYEEARELALQAGKVSASYLQRRLRVGYARAARLLDLMEARGVIGPADGAKPREVFGKVDTVSSEINEL